MKIKLTENQIIGIAEQAKSWRKDSIKPIELEILPGQFVKDVRKLTNLEMWGVIFAVYKKDNRWPGVNNLIALLDANYYAAAAYHTVIEGD